MKDYFSRLLQYDHFTNKQLIEVIRQTGNPPKAVKLMAHLLGAQQVWLGRCEQDPTAPQGPIWPDWPVETLSGVNDANHQRWMAYLAQEADFNRIISYKNSKGDSFADNLTDVLAHLVNHGTHHRAQAGQELKLAGVEKLPVTDYIFYIREKKGQ